MRETPGRLIWLVNKSRRAPSCCHDNKVVHSTAEQQGREETAQENRPETWEPSAGTDVHMATDSRERRRGRGRSLGSSREENHSGKREGSLFLGDFR